jgi:uncharacterized membrane protein
MGLIKIARWFTGLDPSDVRREIRESNTDDMRRRRAIIGLSLIGLGTAAAATLLQTGIVKHLPDPPVGNFDADGVMLSDEAYIFGMPDAAVALAGLALNVPIAAYGSRYRSQDQPLVPVLASVKAAAEAAFAAWYFYQMPAKKKTWCAYCVTAAAVYFSIFALTLPEAADALGFDREK